MIGEATERYVAEVLALQRLTPSEGAARAIAPVLTAQLAAIGPVYAALPFEAEPAAFAGVVGREKA